MAKSKKNKTNKKTGQTTTTLESSVQYYFHQGRAVCITINGQNQHEFDGKNKILSEYTYLGEDMVVQINADGLTSKQKSELFTSTREQARKGELKNTIRDLTTVFLNDNKEFDRLEQIAREQAMLNSKSTNTSYRELLQDLKLYGSGKKGNTIKGGKKGKKVGKKLKAINKLTNNPTVLEFDNDTLSIAVNGSKYRHVYVTTDANDTFDDRISVSVINNSKNKGKDVVFVQKSTLNNGHFNITLDGTGVKLEDVGEIVVTLTKNNGSTLEARCVFDAVPLVSKNPKRHSKNAVDTTPEVSFVIVNSGSNAQEIYSLTKDSEGVTNPNPSNVAASAIYNKADNTIVAYYSIEHPMFQMCVNRVGKVKAKEDEFIKMFEQNLAILAIQNVNNSGSIIDTVDAEAMAIIAFGAVRHG